MGVSGRPPEVFRAVTSEQQREALIQGDIVLSRTMSAGGRAIRPRQIDQ